jgi:CubicO group peptidase (beta-lactamase class C family)
MFPVAEYVRLHDGALVVFVWRIPFKQLGGGSIMRLVRRTLFGALALVLATAGVGFTVFRPDHAAQVAAGVSAQVLCSTVFISQQPAERGASETLPALLGPVAPLIRYDVDRDARDVSARFGFLWAASSRFRPGYGCRLYAASNSPLPETASTTVQQQDGFAPVDRIVAPDPSLSAAMDRVFAESSNRAPKNVKAVVVVRDGRVVAERYASGYGVDTAVRSYSVAKSFTNALLGILVRAGKLRVDQPVSAAEWQSPGDPRAAITVEELLRMDSGLDSVETGSGSDPVSDMLYREADMAGYAAASRLKVSPGSEYEYTSANTLILDRLIGNAIGGGPAGLRAFAESELFAPLHMGGVTMEFDGRGVFVGSERVYATPRDFARFGLLYLNDGAAPDGRRILPEGWTAWSRRSTLDTSYGAGFWTVDGSSPLSARWRGMGLPKDAFFASGNLGQRIYIVPSHKLIVARFGISSPPAFGIEDDIALIKSAIDDEASKRSGEP